ncbi:hypothetical protein NP493_170g00015 [Ridgeia piscesae]|uniref:Peflin n=1 Tax=Ridgeia piscesae TaxID=27915 RepID=A0AAD9P3C3_RIDPI|nr:hypothetical protein NP493_170g00015 [Ridgeia piscesae]
MCCSVIFSGGYGQNPPPPANYTPPGGYQQQVPRQPAYAPGYTGGAAPGGYNPAGGYAGAAPGGYNPAGAAPGGYNPAGGYRGAAPGGYNPAGGYGGAAAPGGVMYGAQRYGAPAQGPPPGVKPELWNWFQTVDADHSGQISVTELQQALLNGNWSPFNPETCRLMIGMFDRNKFDRDRSGNIDGAELHQAFQTFGYNLSANFVNLCLRVFNRQKTSTINFDDFIQCSVLLKTLTDQFRAKDVQGRGVIQLQYEEFLIMVLANDVV